VNLAFQKSTPSALRLPLEPGDLVTRTAKLAGRVLPNALRPLWIGLSRTLDEIAARRTWRRVTVVTLETLFAVVSVTAAAAIVYSGQFWLWPHSFYLAALILIASKLLAGVVTGSFGSRWRYVGVRDAMVIARTALIAGGAGLIALHELQLVNTSLRLVGADTAIYLLLACSTRLVARGLHEWARRTAVRSDTPLRRAVIVGAGEAGAALIKNILVSPKLLMTPVAVVDDDANKHGNRLHDTPIVGAVTDLSAIVQKYRADEIIIAIPTASSEQVTRIMDACVATRLPFRIAPDPEEVLGRSGHRQVSTLRDVQASDLLGRAQAELDLDALRAELSGARIVITGAAGSIGSELTRQLVKLDPAVIYLVDRNENDLYFLCEELERRGITVPHIEVILDVRDERRLTRVIREAAATHVFHAAAFKHVPLMEFHLPEAVENNILGTWTVLQAAHRAGATKFVLISTDKAVRPSSVMGATKRFCELLVSEATRENGMRGVIVRFGNVLGSNGSVVPLFERQISEGGPVTVTSCEATRYFMTPAEAAQLVLQAVSMPESDGKVAILDMGTPVRIWDLAERLIRMKGLRPGADIEIVEVGLRPGEKLHEELWWHSGHVAPSSHPKIMLGEVGTMPGGAGTIIPAIRALIEADEEIGLRELLMKAVGLTNGNGAHERRTPPRGVRAVAQDRTVSLEAM
jgi:FlaA1/EpsC-like NDP-sugar epimerase